MRRIHRLDPYKSGSDSVLKGISKDQVKGIECKHAFYAPSRDSSSQDDLLFVKEVIHLKDGTLIPNTRRIKNYQRDFYVTREFFRNHEQKKEWEQIERLQKFSCNQKALVQRAARALGRTPPKDPRTLGDSPYLYGYDVTTPTLIKQKYMSRWPDCVSTNNVAVLDIETNVLGGREDPIMIGVTYRDKAYLGFTKDFMAGFPDPEGQMKKVCDRLLKDVITERKIEIEYQMVDNPGALCKEAIDRCHQWQPDFVEIWNIDFDVPRMEETLAYYKYDVARVFSDPSVPDEFCYYSFEYGPYKHKKDNGEETPIPGPDQWHGVDAPASFTWICGMRTYRHLRKGDQRETSFSLDAILNKYLKRGKLKTATTEGEGGLAWHITMQKHHKLDYGAYCLFDCIGVEMLDEKILDLRQSITTQIGYSQHTIFGSQPKRLIDKYHFFCLENGHVLAARPKKMKTKLDEYVVSRNGWIITLPSQNRVSNIGLNVVKEFPMLATNVFAAVADLDVSAGLV